MTYGDYNIFLGANARSSVDSVQHAMAIGTFAYVSCDTCIALGNPNAQHRVGINLPAPFARLQVPQSGSLNNGGLDVTNAAIYIGETQTQGMAFDENQIESVGDDLYLNFNSDSDVRMVEGGGNVGIDAGTPIAPLHVGEGHTVLFGKDTIGDGTVGSKFIFFPGKGGAFRAGHLSYDGSVGNGTTFWDPDSVAWASIAIGNNTRAIGTASTAIGIRTHADNFGAVALGHLSRAKGNSSIAAGYYTRSDAYVSTAFGPGNVGGGNPHAWVATDPIFEIGNSIDTSARHNALTVLKNGQVGIETATPNASLHIKQLSSFSDGGIRLEYNTDTDYWETWIDGANDYNFAYNGTLKAYIQDTDGAYVSTSDRRLKQEIRSVGNVLDKLRRLQPSTYRFRDADENSRSVGLIAQDVQPLFPELVHEKDGLLGINYQGLGVLTIRAVQEMAEDRDAMHSEIDRLTVENLALKTQLADLLQRVSNLEYESSKQ
ncbi:MAG: tail fiber domain-containing protein [Saprospiraceae bacterium]|nr:tail fiber domain-containing protein [Saprospiraceae bacterium]